MWGAGHPGLELSLVPRAALLSCCRPPAPCSHPQDPVAPTPLRGSALLRSQLVVTTWVARCGGGLLSLTRWPSGLMLFVTALTCPAVVPLAGR